MNELVDLDKFIVPLSNLLVEVGFDADAVKQILAQIKTDDDIEHLIYQIQDFFNTKKLVLEAEAKFYETFQQVYPAVIALQTASGLTNEAAKTCVYYAVGTYGLEQLQSYPILVFQGATGTGKSGAMKVLAQLVYEPFWLGTNLSKASLRDKLDKAKNATAFIEEGDSVAEDIISNRYDKETAKTSVKRTTGTGWFDTSVTYFGASILHKRKPFNDAATANRAIVIKTRNKPGNYHVSQVADSVRDGLKQLYSQSLQKLAEPPDMPIAGRAADTWKPLIAVAATCGDIEWLMYCLKEAKKAMDKLKLGQEFEPEAEVLNALIALSGKRMVELSEIREKLGKECNWQPSAWAIADMVRDLGFEVKTSHGERKVTIDKELLAAKAKELGIELDTEPDISIRNLSG